MHKVKWSPFQTVCHIFLGLRVKSKSSCAAGRPRSSEHSLERNLEIQQTIHNIKFGNLLGSICSIRHLETDVFTVIEVISMWYRGSLKAILTPLKSEHRKTTLLLVPAP